MEYSLVIFLTLVVCLVPYFRRNFFLVSPVPEKNGPSEELSGKREEFFDFLKGSAILAVVMIHSAYFYIMAGEEIHEVFLWWANDLSRFAIPVFFISSGVLLSPGSRKNYWRKKIVRILVPYLLVAISVAIFRNYPLGRAMKEIFTGEILVPFYFVIVLFQFYLIHPILVRFRSRSWFLPAAFIISIWSYFYWPSQYIAGFPTFLPHLFFFAYGVRGREKFLSFEIRKHLSSVWFWLFLLDVYVAFLIVWPEQYYNHRYFFGLAVFNLLFFFRNNQSVIFRWVAIMGRKSLWIFLIHFPITGLFYQKILQAGPGFYFGFMAVFVFSVFFSFLGAFILEKIYSPIEQKLIAGKRPESLV